MKKQLLTLGFAVLLAVFGMVSCNKDDTANREQEPEKTAQSIVSFSEKDLTNTKKEVLDAAYGKSETAKPTEKSDDPIEDLLNKLNETDEEPTAENPVINKIVDNARIEKAEIQEDGKASVVVYAPDMSKILNALLERDYSEPLSSDELESYILSSLEDKENYKKYEIKVGTIEADGKRILDSADEELRNALTGGFRDAYIEFYNKSVEALLDALSSISGGEKDD